MPERESRLDVLERICALTGGAIRIIEARKAWPALVDVATGGESFLASLHVGTVGYTHRDLDHVERRYQNPSNLAPIVALPGTRPMLLGLWTQEETPVLVAHDAGLRQGHGGTRVSLFVGLAALREAASPVGWGEYEGATGERIIACRPSLLPMLAEMLLHAVVPGEGQTHQALVAAGPVTTDPAAFERARRAVSVLIRDATFRKRVVAAYGGQCALCGLGLGLVEGAHIYPASAPN
jgi:hypothetical protein